MRHKVAVLLLALVAACARPAVVSSPPPAAEPSTDVYTYKLERIIPFGERLVNVSNRRGYDNQPYWDRSALLYTAQVGGQYDIYRHEDGASRPVTTTPESEYSASLAPDGSSITVVRVEQDSTQRLWRFPDDGGPPTVILPQVKPVGYFAWLDSTTLALFVLGTPNTLRIADTRTGAARVATHSIGRSLQRIPGGRRASFVQRSGSHWVLKAVDPRTMRMDSIAVLPDSAEYVTWRSDRVVYTAGGSRVYRMELPRQSWTVVVDLADRGIRRISRVALSPDGRTLAFVADDAR